MKIQKALQTMVLVGLSRLQMPEYAAHLRPGYGGCQVLSRACLPVYALLLAWTMEWERGQLLSFWVPWPYPSLSTTPIFEHLHLVRLGLHCPVVSSPGTGRKTRESPIARNYVWKKISLNL